MASSPNKYPPAKLVDITPPGPNAVPIWAFHNPMSVTDVKAAIPLIKSKLSGSGWRLNILSGTHGYCEGMVGAPATPEQRFTEEDRKAVEKAAGLLTNGFTMQVIDFQNNSLPKDPDFRVSVKDWIADLLGLDTSPQYKGLAMKKLNDVMNSIGTEPKQAFLLAWCCSAGTEAKP